jgi:hypothetical protein
MYKSVESISFKFSNSYDQVPFRWIGLHHKYTTTITNNDVSITTKFILDYTDQHVGSKTRTKLHKVNN